MKLEPGEVLCPECKGGKEIWFCPRCLGTGKLDWVELCMGKKEKCHYIKPGVYTQEVDLSAKIPSFNQVKIIEI